MSRTSSAVKERYNNKTYDRVQFLVYKGEREQLQAAAAANGFNVSTLVVSLVNDWLTAQGRTPLMSNERKLKSHVLAALDEADRIAYDDTAKSYTSAEELFKAWRDEDNEDKV